MNRFGIFKNQREITKSNESDLEISAEESSQYHKIPKNKWEETHQCKLKSVM